MESGLKRALKKKKKKELKFPIFIPSEVHVCKEGCTRIENTSFSTVVATFVRVR